MKKVISLLLAIIMCIGLCACGGDIEPSEPEKTPEDKVESAVRAQISAMIMIKYETAGSPSITTYIREIGDNLYEVTGKVTVRDKYGDSYTGKYDAEVKYNADTGKCSVDLDLGDLYRS